MKNKILLSIVLAFISAFQLLHAQEITAFDLQWTYLGVRHDGLLFYTGDDHWHMRVKYTKQGQTIIIEECLNKAVLAKVENNKTEKVRVDEDWIVLKGSSVTFITRSIRNNKYDTDNLVIVPDGKTFKIFNFGEGRKEFLFVNIIKTISTEKEFDILLSKKYGGS